jgi:hypothetical protein
VIHNKINDTVKKQSDLEEKYFHTTNKKLISTIHKEMKQMYKKQK